MAKKTSSMEGSELDMLYALNLAVQIKPTSLKHRKKEAEIEPEIEKLTDAPESERERCSKISREKDVIETELSRRGDQEADRLKARVQQMEETENMWEHEVYVGQKYLAEIWGERNSLRDEMAEILDEKYAIENQKTELLVRIGDLEKICKEQESEIEGLVEKVMKLAKANIEAKYAAAKVSHEDGITTMLTPRTSDLINDNLELKKARLESRVAEMETRMKEVAEKLEKAESEKEREKAEHGVIVKKLEEQLEAMNGCCYRHKEAKVEELSQTLKKSEATAEGSSALVFLIAFLVALIYMSAGKVVR